MFNENYCINLSTSEKLHGLTYVTLSRAKKLSQIALLLEITGTRIDSLSNNAKTVQSHEPEWIV